MSDKGERLLRAIRNDPDLLYEVCVALRDERVAGPWTRGPSNKMYRALPSGKKVAVVNRHPTRNVHPWEASVSGTVTGGEQAAKNHQQQGHALDWCDARLLENGFDLAADPRGG